MMRKSLRTLCIYATLGLVACDVTVHDRTPAEMQADGNIAMYPITAQVEHGALVSPSGVFLRVRTAERVIDLTPDKTHTRWTGLYSVRCKPSFPVQYRALWTVQGVTGRSAVFPPSPREIQLLEPPPVREVKIDTSGKKGAKGWEGVVSYRFVTAPITRITSARIEHAQSDAAGDQSGAQAEAISVISELPVEAACGQSVDVRVISTQPVAQGTLVIETNNRRLPSWRTRVEFGPVGS